MSAMKTLKVVATDVRMAEGEDNKIVNGFDDNENKMMMRIKREKRKMRQKAAVGGRGRGGGGVPQGNLSWTAFHYKNFCNETLSKTNFPLGRIKVHLILSYLRDLEARRYLDHRIDDSTRKNKSCLFRKIS